MYLKALLTTVLAVSSLASSSLLAQTPDEIVNTLFNQEVIVDLCSPTFHDGELSTEEGGVVKSGDLRIQAQKIRYIRKRIDNESVCRVEAEGNLMVHYADLVFIGERVEYDFENYSGSITCGRTVIENWHFSGETIYLRADGSYDICGGTATTCESCEAHWRLCADSIAIDCNHDVCARDIRVFLQKLPVFWFPYFRANIDSLMESPIRYRFAIGGHRRLMVGMRYQLLSWECLKTYLILDYRIKPGPGAGLETEFTSPNGQTSFRTRNYLAYDRSDFNTRQDGRYRIQGLLQTHSASGCTTMQVGWDRLSDKDVATDYQEDSFYLKTSERTEVHLRHETCDFVSNLYTRLRLNKWETVLQEIPHFQIRMRPQNIANTGIYADLFARAAYLDYSFSNDFSNGADFNSTRVEMHPRVWSPFHFANLHVTPEAGFVSIYYGKSPDAKDQWQAIGHFGANANADFYKCYGDCKHLLRPYIDYAHSSMPTVHHRDHHVFGLMDGWYRMNRLTFGVEQRLLQHDCCGIHRRWALDLWAHSFLHTDKIARSIPRYYGTFTMNPTTQFSGKVETAWDVERKEMAFLNIRGELTVSSDVAIAGEWRHREGYDWRKAHRNHFMLDLARSETELVNSVLSDPRDTLLLHIFYRINPVWATEWVCRYGWNRPTEKDYIFYEASAYTRLHCGWYLRMSYQHREHDDRFTIALQLKPKPPDLCDYNLTDFIR